LNFEESRQPASKPGEKLGKNKIQKDRRMKGGNKTAKERNTDEKKKINSSGQI
jgi:hypothetical protein